MAAGLVAALLLLAALPAAGQSVVDVRPEQAAPGSTVRIYGSGLDVVTSVQIGGQTASILDVLLGGTVLTARVPDKIRGPVDVTLFTLTSSTTAPDVFTAVRGGPGSPWTESALLSDDDDNSYPRSIDTGDLDGDGDVDVVVGLEGTSEILVYRNDGSGTYTEDDDVSISTANYPRDVLLADVVDEEDASRAGDGDLDIIVGAGSAESSDGNNRVLLYENNGDGSFSNQTLAQESDDGEPVLDVRSVDAGDVDGDGDVDLVVASAEDDGTGNGPLTLLRNDDADKTFTPEELPPSSATSDYRSARLADVDQDGELELFVADHTSPGTIALYENDGSTLVFDRTLDDAVSNPTKLDVGDFDGDGYPGVTYISPDTGELFAIVNTGNSFGSPTTVQSGLGSVESLHAADVSQGDETDEILYGDAGTGAFVWTTVFGSSTQIDGASSNAKAIGSGDADGDGDLDPFLLSRFTDEVALFRNGASPPAFSSFPGDQTIDEDASTTVTFGVDDTEDTDGDLTPSATSTNTDLVLDSGLSVNDADGDGLYDLSVTPRPDSNSAAPTGPTDIIVELTDTDGNTVSRSFTLTVTALNDVPTASSDSYTTNEDQQLSVSAPGVLANDTDVDVGDDLSVNSGLVVSPTDGSVTVNADGSFTYTPDSNFNGSDSFTYEITDGTATAQASATIAVDPVNDPPTIEPVADQSIFEDNTLSLTGLQTNDVDNPFGDLSVTASSDTPDLVPDANISVSGPDGSGLVDVTATPRADSIGSATLTLTVSDGAASFSESFVVDVVSPLAITPAPAPFFALGADSRRDRRVTIENQQSTDQTISRLEITGADAGAFQILTSVTTPLTLTPGETLALDLRYAPTTAAGTQTATLEVESSVDVETAAISGTAEARRTLDLGRVSARRPVNGTFSLANPLPQDVTISDVSFTGPDAAAFAVTDDVQGEVLASGASTPLPITFQSEEVRTFDATLTVTTSADQRVVDLSAQTLLLQVAVDGPVPPEVQTSIPLQVQVPNDISPSRSTVYSRPTGATSYRETSFSALAGETASASIPAESVTAAGVQFYVEVVEETADGPVRLTFPAASPIQQPAGIATRIPSIAAQGSTSARTYRMYSFPVRPDTTVASVLTAPYNFGPYDRSEWRAFRYPPSLDERQTSNRTVEDVTLQEFPDIDSLNQPGTAFWHVTQTGQSLSVRNAVSADPSGPVTVDLLPGWNQIGSPFLFPVAWQTILDATRTQLSDPDRLDALDRINAPVAWTGSRYRYDRPVLAPWRGYFIYNPNPDQTVRLVVPPTRTAGSQAVAGSSLAKPSAAAPSSRSVADVAAERLVDSTGAALMPYRLQLHASARVDALDRTLTDAANWIGLLKGARAGAGPEDVPEAPPVGQYVRLSVLRDDAPYQHWAGSFKPAETDGHTWDLEVTARVRERFYTNKTVTVDLREHGSLPDGFELYVIDRTDGRLLSTGGSTFDVPLTADTPTRQLRVLIGTESFAKTESDGVPLKEFTYALDGNAPNPFDDQTEIAYQLKKQSTVRLAIYDVLGRRVRTLIDGKRQGAGPHAVDWNGTNDAGRSVASGVYLYRLRAGDFTATGKMTVIR